MRDYLLRSVNLSTNDLLSIKDFRVYLQALNSLISLLFLTSLLSVMFIFVIFLFPLHTFFLSLFFLCVYSWLKTWKISVQINIHTKRILSSSTEPP